MKILLHAFILFTAAAVPLAREQSTQFDRMRDARVIHSSPNGPSIASMIRDDDKFVIVQRGGVISEFVDDRVPTLVEDLDSRARDSDIIAVAELERRDSFPTEDGAWIGSTLTLKVLKVVKDSRPSLPDANDKVKVFQGGGEITIKTARVRAGEYYEFLPRRRYLVFLIAVKRGDFGFLGIQLKIGDDGRITPIDLSTGVVASAESPLYGLPLQNVVEELRRRSR